MQERLRKWLTRGLVATSSPVVEKTIELGAGFLELLNKTDPKSVSKALINSYSGWVYANVRAIAEEVSQMEFELYQVKIVANEIVYVPIFSHPVLDLLDRFNPYQAKSEALFVTQAQIDLAGDTFYLLDGGKGGSNNIKNIFILQPDKITVHPSGAADGYEIKNYTYKDVIDGKVVVTTYEPDEIIQIKNPNPANPLRGKSVVEAAAVTVDTDVLAGEFNKNFFKNSAVPSMVFTTDARVTRDDIERITSDLRNRSGGAANAFKTMLLGGGLKPANMQMTNRDMDFIEGNKWTRDKIMAMFKNTKTSLGIVEDVNRANAEASMLGWKQSTIKPKMKMICDTLNEFLIPRYGMDLILGFADPVPENREAKIAEIDKMVGRVMTVNESRSELGLKEMPDPAFDELKDPNAPPPAPFGQPPPPEPPPPPKGVLGVDYRKVLRKNGILENLAFQRDIYAASHDSALKWLKGRKTKQPAQPEPPKQINSHFSDERIRQYEAKQLKIVDTAEKRFERNLTRFIEQLVDKALANLHAAVPKSGKVRQKAYDLIQDDEEVSAALDLFTPLLGDVGSRAAQEAYRLLGVRAPYVPTEELNAVIRAQVELFAGSMVATDKDILSGILEEGIRNGQGIPEIERSIRTEFENYTKVQSDRIARTEILRTSNSGALDAFRESGVVDGKQWLCAADPDEECADYCGNEVMSLGTGGFYSETDDFADGDPPLHPNCRCVIIPILADTKAVNPRVQELEAQLTSAKDYAKQLEATIGLGDD